MKSLHEIIKKNEEEFGKAFFGPHNVDEISQCDTGEDMNMSCRSDCVVNSFERTTLIFHQSQPSIVERVKEMEITKEQIWKAMGAKNDYECLYPESVPEKIKLIDLLQELNKIE